MKKNLIIIAALALIIAAVFVFALTRGNAPAVPEGAQIVMEQAVPTEAPAENPMEAPTAMPTENPTAAPTAEPTAAPTDAVSAEPTAEPAGYVLCSLPGSGYYGFIPLPAEGEVSYPIYQVLSDGTKAENMLHLTPEGFYMESANCANQDCVGEGMVTFENRDARALGNSVICLPNQVMVELYTAEEVAQMNAQGSAAK